ncbi:centrosomal protein of 85 kDa-like isoform X1 [Gadus macrocephalus]|uniref:centrosomal protein of 85 kDa-like isoform X1 n=1 Tax=Gadus macrocephalus TaxID=80720 RepID=UPI0028CBC016|nr:centrosomal protein of 85 kDa-like isoform X1 [Gadus macrocephalus]
MWGRSDFEDGYESYKTGSSCTSNPGWVSRCESGWQGNPSAPSNGNQARRHSTASDSGDTGIGTSCSDSVEDHSSSSTTPLSFHPLVHHRSAPGGSSTGTLPTAHVLPSPSPSSSGSAKLSVATSPGGASPWSSLCQLSTPAASSRSDLPGSLDMKDPQPIRRWSSLTRLSAGTERSAGKGLGSRCKPDPHGSLDRKLLHGYRHDSIGQANMDAYLSTSSHFNPLLRSPCAADPHLWYDRGGRPSGVGQGTESSRSSALSSPLKPRSLDLNYSALPESRLGPGGPGHGFTNQRGLSFAQPAVGGSPIQPAIRTQMWLSEQMEYRPGSELGKVGPEVEGGAESSLLLAWQQEHQHRERLRQEGELNQMLSGTSLPVNTLVKIKEGLLRQRELEIDRQKQQIFQLHARIRENELRAQQFLHNQRDPSDQPYILKPKDPLHDSVSVSLSGPPSESQCCNRGELGRKLADAQLEVLHLNEFLKQNTQKYTEDIKKLEEKMKTRDRYISSLKKKCQRETEQNKEKQQRIETLEKYLADLPSLDQAQSQTLQLEEAQRKAEVLEETVSQLEENLVQDGALLKHKDSVIQAQSLKEKELMAAVHSLQQKVEHCLKDGVRLPMLDLKHLEVENTQLLKQQEQSSKLIDQQKKQIEGLSVQLTNQRPPEDGLPGRPAAPVHMQDVNLLLKEMSLCLLDLKALCSVLTQRARGQEPNLALLLGIKSMGFSGEENEGSDVTEEDNVLRAKVQEVSQLRSNIDELRRTVSDRYAQDMGENCITQ